MLVRPESTGRGGSSEAPKPKPLAQPPDNRGGRVADQLLRAPAGSRVFSAGHDVNELPRHGRDPLTYDDPLRLAVRRIETHPAPVIAMVEGSVWAL